MALRAEERKTEIIDGILAQLGGRLPAGDAALADRFVRLFYRDVAAADLVERDPLDLYGAALALFRFGQERRPGRAEAAGLQPAPRAARLAVGPHDRRDRQRRHAVPGRQRRHGAEPARARRPPGHPSAGRRSGATRRGGSLDLGPASGDGEGTRESFMHVEVDRQSDPDRLARLETDLLRILGDVRAAVTDWRAMRDKVGEVIADLSAGAARAAGAPSWTRPRRSCAGWPTTTSPSRLQRLRARGGRRRATSCGASRARASASCAATTRAALAQLRRSAARGARPRARPPSRWCVTKAQRAQHGAPRRPTSTSSASSASPPTARSSGEHRFLGLFTSAAYNREPARDPAAAPQGRGGGRARRLRRPAGTPARRSPTSSRPTRATSCSRPRDDELFRIATEILAAAGPPEAAAVRAARPFRPLRLLPRLRAARPLQHGRPRADAAHPRGGAARHARPSSRPSSRESRARPPPVHRPHAGRHSRRPRRRGARAAAGRGLPALEPTGSGQRSWPTAARRTATGSSPPSAADAGLLPGGGRARGRRPRPPGARPPRRGAVGTLG